MLLYTLFAFDEEIGQEGENIILYTLVSCRKPAEWMKELKKQVQELHPIIDMEQPALVW